MECSSPRRGRDEGNEVEAETTARFIGIQHWCLERYGRYWIRELLRSIDLKSSFSSERS